jgi:hypothetical protein
MRRLPWWHGNPRTRKMGRGFSSIARRQRCEQCPPALTSGGQRPGAGLPALHCLRCLAGVVLGLACGGPYHIRHPRFPQWGASRLSHLGTLGSTFEFCSCENLMRRKGTYLGGSTTIGPRSGWFSKDSSEPPDDHRPVKIRAAAPGAQSQAGGSLFELVNKRVHGKRRRWRKRPEPPQNSH